MCADTPCLTAVVLFPRGLSYAYQRAPESRDLYAICFSHKGCNGWVDRKSAAPRKASTR